MYNCKYRCIRNSGQKHSGDNIGGGGLAHGGGDQMGSRKKSIFGVFFAILRNFDVYSGGLLLFLGACC